MATLDTAIDGLYQLPLKEFIPSRKQLAAELSGADKRMVASLAKPSVPAWAVNQLYWQERETYDALVDAARDLRTAHRKVLEGRNTDLREPATAHRAAVDAAATKVGVILKRSGLGASPATMTAVIRTLEALPAGDRPGRLSRPLEPAGFEILAGIKPRAPLRLIKPDAEPTFPPSQSFGEASPERARGKRAAADKSANSLVKRNAAAARARRELKAAQAAAAKTQRAVDAAKARLKAAQAAEARYRAAHDRAIAKRATIEREVSRLSEAAEAALRSLRRRSGDADLARR